MATVEPGTIYVRPRGTIRAVGTGRVGRPGTDGAPSTTPGPGGPAGPIGPDGATVNWIIEGWTAGTPYLAGDGASVLPDVLGHNDAFYVCIASHTSTFDNEPGVGVNWTVVWRTVGTEVTSVNGQTDDVVLDYADVGAPSAASVTALQVAVAAINASLGTASSATLDLDGTLAANSDLRIPSQKAIVTYIAARVAAIVGGAPGTLDALNELATALGNDPNFATTITALIGTKIAASLFDANTILTANTDNTPGPLTIAAQTIVGRITGGQIAALTPSQIRTMLTLVVGTDVEAHDADLTAIAALTSAADKLLYATGPQTWALADLTPTARTLLDDSSTAAMLVTLGATPLSGWIEDVLTRTGNYTFTVPRDTTKATGDGSIDQGTRIRYKDGGTGSFEYGAVISAVNAAGTTTVTLATNSDYSCATSFANAAYSNLATPAGYPGWLNFTPTPSAGWTTFGTTAQGMFKIDGNQITVEVNVSGTSTGTTAVINAPVPAATVTDAGFGTAMFAAVDVGASLTAAGRVFILSGGSTFTCNSNMGAGAWGNSGTKQVRFVITYKI